MLFDGVTRAMRQVLDLLCGARCPGCGSSSSGVAPCDRCVATLVALPAAAGAAFPDHGVAARLVRAGKHGHWRGAGRTLAGLLAARLAGQRFQAVTWIPADARRRARRGMCLPEAIARALARTLGMDAVPLLVRTRSSRSQRGRARQDRIDNVAGAYRLRSGLDPTAMAGLHVLVVDDIRTTGATLAEACRVLEAHGAIAMPLAVTGVDQPSACEQRSTIAVEFPQRARKFCSRSGSVLPIRSGTNEERQFQDLNAPRPP